MDISERNAIETKERLLRVDLNAQLRKAGELQHELRVEAHRREGVAAEFKKLKQQLLQGSLNAENGETMYGLQQLDSLAGRLRLKREALATVDHERAALAQRLREVGAGYVQTKQQLDKVSHLLKAESKRDQLKADELEIEECSDIQIAARAEDVSRIAVDCEPGDLSCPSTDSRALPVDLSGRDSQRRDSREPETAGKQHNPGGREERSADKHFKEAIPSRPQFAISELKSWSDLRGEGVVLTVQARSGRALDIAINSVGDRRVKVSLLARDERDRRVLWDEKSEILTALRAGGYEVDEVSIRRSDV